MREYCCWNYNIQFKVTTEHKTSDRNKKKPPNWWLSAFINKKEKIKENFYLFFRRRLFKILFLNFNYPLFFYTLKIFLCSFQSRVFISNSFFMLQSVGCVPLTIFSIISGARNLKSRTSLM